MRQNVVGSHLACCVGRDDRDAVRRPLPLRRLFQKVHLADNLLTQRRVSDTLVARVTHARAGIISHRVGVVHSRASVENSGECWIPPGEC